MNDVIIQYEGNQIHVVLNNLSTHMPKLDRWLVRHKNVHFHYTPTHASSLNQAEVWFSILTRHALSKTSFTSVYQLIEAIETYCAVYHQKAYSFEWTKGKVFQGTPEDKYAKLCN